jgi:Fe-S-cluster containining protein
MSVPGERFLKFRCTGCGNCCKEPLLPLTDEDVRRIQARTGDSISEIVRWVDKDGIEMDDEPEAFVVLRQGKRVMVLAHERGGCRYLGADNRCGIYTSRPLGCRIYPFDPTFSKKGTLRRLNIVQATECPYELDGQNDIEEIQDLNARYQQAHHDFNDKIAAWNRAQGRRKRSGKTPGAASDFLRFLGLVPTAEGVSSEPR